MADIKLLALLLGLAIAVWLIRRAFRNRKHARLLAAQAATGAAPGSRPPRRWPLVIFLILFSVIVLFVTGRGGKTLIVGVIIVAGVWAIALFRMRGRPLPVTSAPAPPGPRPAVNPQPVARQAPPASSPMEDLMNQAKGGDPKAQLQLAGLYDNGSTVAQDHAIAFGWCKKAADQGYAQAQYWLGRKLAEGLGTLPDTTQAIRYLQLAAAQGLPQAKDLLLRISL